MSGLDRYELQALIAVQWNPALAAQFPDTGHTGCRQEMWANHATGTWMPFVPPRCVDWHCPECGRPCNLMGSHDCGAT